MTVKCVFIAGIRSQYMKLAAFQKYVFDWNKKNEEKLELFSVNAGQHYDEILSGSFINELDIKFDYDLTNKYSINDAGIIFVEMIPKLLNLIHEINPDYVIVIGDANTTLAGAIAASKTNAKLVHIEAGVRTYDLMSGEEKNRIAVDHLADIRFLSSKSDQMNLLSEGLSENSVWSGDLIYDLILRYSTFLNTCTSGMLPDNYILVSIHRKENLMSNAILKNIFAVLGRSRFPIIFLAHPTTKRKISESSLLNQTSNIEIIDGLSYLQTLATIKDARYLLTDSGAFQREAFYLKKRCLIRQDVPFWGALIKSNVHKAIGTTVKEINNGIKWIEEAREHEYPILDEYGDGKAADRIVDGLLNILQ